MQGTNLRNMNEIISPPWMKFFEEQEHKVRSQNRANYTPFRNSYVLWFLGWIAGGGCTRKTYIEARDKTKWDCFWRIFTIFSRMQVPMNIHSKLKLYRCMFLPKLYQQIQQTDSKKQKIPHKLPSSWSYDKQFCINWCKDKIEEGKEDYILEIGVTPEDLFILNILNNIKNEGQREVVLAPCILVVDRVVGKTVKCSIKNYYKINHETGNVHV